MADKKKPKKKTMRQPCEPAQNPTPKKQTGPSKKAGQGTSGKK